MAMKSCDAREEWNTRLFERKSFSFSALSLSNCEATETRSIYNCVTFKYLKFITKMASKIKLNPEVTTINYHVFNELKLLKV